MLTSNENNTFVEHFDIAWKVIYLGFREILFWFPLIPLQLPLPTFKYLEDICYLNLPNLFLM